MGWRALFNHSMKVHKIIKDEEWELRKYIDFHLLKKTMKNFFKLVDAYSIPSYKYYESHALNVWAKQYYNKTINEKLDIFASNMHYYSDRWCDWRFEVIKLAWLDI